MIRLIRIFRKCTEVKKPGYNPEYRKLISQLPETAFLQRLFIENETLFLPEKEFKVLNEQIHKNTEVIVWNEYYSSREDTIVTDPALFEKRLRAKKANPFMIKINEDGKTELHVFEDSPFMNEVPKRQDHKIADLGAGQLINYKVNYKSDSRGTRESQRSYKECNYLIHYLGTFEKIEILDPKTALKTLDQNRVKTIDERKILH